MPIISVILIPLLTLLALPLKEINRKYFYSLVVSLGLINTCITWLMKTHLYQIDLGYHMVFLIDRYSWFFALLINLAWLITIIYSYSFVSYNFQQKAAKFNAYLAIVISMALATGFAGNLLTLFVFYTLSIPFIYPLIALRNSEQAISAAKFYLWQTLAPAILFFLPAVAIVYSLEGDFNFTSASPGLLSSKPILASIVIAMFIIGMSKNCIFPFNSWLPRTMVAPAPVSALIHSVAAVKYGPIALMKIAVYVYGLDFLQQLSSHFHYIGWLTYLCGFTALYAAYKAYKVHDMKQRFSYSTVSQLSYIITAILVASKTVIVAAMLHIITHSIAKICLFFAAGTYSCLYHTTDVREIAKIAPKTKLLAISIAFCGFSIAGFPFLAGYLSKDLMLLEELHHGNYAAVTFLVLGSLLNFIYILPILKAAFWNKHAPELESKPVPKTMTIAISLCLLLMMLLSVYTYYIIRTFESF